MLISPDIYFEQCLSGQVLHNSLLHLLLKNGDFLKTDISQGSVATRLGCGRVFVHDFVTNFLLSLTVKEFWKPVNIWWSYGQELGVLFFLTHSVYDCRLVSAKNSQFAGRRCKLSFFQLLEQNTCDWHVLTTCRFCVQRYWLFVWLCDPQNTAFLPRSFFSFISRPKNIDECVQTSRCVFVPMFCIPRLGSLPQHWWTCGLSSTIMLI